MSRVIRWALPVMAALSLVVTLSATRAFADDAKSPTVAISVVNADGSAAVDAIVKIYKKGEEPKKHVHGEAAPTTEPAPVATVTTKDDGKVSVALPVGDYVANAVLKSHGHGTQDITVKDGDNAVTITLKAKPPHNAATPAPGGAAAGDAK